MLRPHPGLVLTELERLRMTRLIRTTCSASLMSDTKWRKFIEVLSKLPDLDQYVLKSLRHPSGLPGQGWLSGYAPHAFMDSFAFGPVWLREIEWIEFPRLAPRRVGERRTMVGAKAQDIDGLRKGLEAVGRFPLEESERGLRLIGHIRATAPAG